MALPNEVVSEFVEVTNDRTETKKEATVYGTIVEHDGAKYVRLDGSDLLTPVAMTVDANHGERVTVLIKNHTATVTGNTSSPAARTDRVEDIGTDLGETKEDVSDLEADNVTIHEDLVAKDAQIESLEADNVVIRETLVATDAYIKNLEADYGHFVELSADKFTAIEADIKILTAGQITVEDLKADYATIDFANIGDAAVENFLAKSGMVDDLVVSEGHVTGTLVGVTIIGDMIKGGTIQADKLVVKGKDGLYYKLNVEGGATTSEQISEEELQNGLSGTIIVAKSVTAEKIAVDDLYAFDATIGGFIITSDSLYSGVKASVDNTTPGVYLDKEGQMSIGDSDNFLKYYKDDDGNARLEIAASSLVFSTSGKTVEQTIEEATDIEIGARNLIRNSDTLIFSDYGFESQQSETDDGIVYNEQPPIATTEYVQDYVQRQVPKYVESYISEALGGEY